MEDDWKGKYEDAFQALEATASERDELANTVVCLEKRLEEANSQASSALEQVRALREEAAVKDTRITRLQTALEECRSNPASPAFVAKKGESTGVSATPLKWHQLKHIQTGDKWYKALQTAQADLEDSRSRAKQYREQKWAPPTLELSKS